MDARERASEQRGIPLDHVVVDRSDTRVAMWVGVVFVIGAAFVTITLLAGGSGLSQWAVFAVVGIGLAAVGIRAWAVAVRWENPQLFLPGSDPLRLGGEIVARYRRRGRGGTDATGATLTAELVCEERATYRRGSETRTATEIVYRGPVTCVGTGEGRVVEADLRVTVPVFDAPPTMDLGNNEVVWRIVVMLRAPSAPDDESTFPVVIAPVVRP